jgi:hypothetical protein
MGGFGFRRGRRPDTPDTNAEAEDTDGNTNQ